MGQLRNRVPGDTGQTRTRQVQRAAILAALAELGGSAQWVDIRNAVPWGGQTVSRHLRALQLLGKVRRTSRGWWHLVEPPTSSGGGSDGTGDVA